jgi:hypothetical protein
MDLNSFLWGNNNAAALTIVVQSLAPGIAAASIGDILIPGGVNDTSIGGTLTAYAGLPLYNTTRGCGIVVRA